MGKAHLRGIQRQEIVVGRLDKDVGVGIPTETVLHKANGPSKDWAVFSMNFNLCPFGLPVPHVASGPVSFDIVKTFF